VQVPTWPGTSHAWHWPLQLELQHTPSTHWPFAHWLAPAQALPFARNGMQRPPEQKVPVTQSVSLAQLPRQAVAPQT
jgi:hypothetical protein